MKVERPPVALEAAVPRRRSALLAPFGFRDFRLLWMGLVVSNLGTWMQFTTLGYLVAAAAANGKQASLFVGILGMSSAVPVVLLSPLAGVVADRFPRRQVLFVTNGLQIGLALTLGILTSMHLLAVWEMCVLAGLRSTTQAFDAPARQSWVPLLVPREYVGNAIGLNSIAFNAPSVIGPPLAGALILSIGAAASFYVNAVATFAVVLALVFMAPAPPSSTRPEGVLASIVAGLGFLYRHPVLRSVVALLAATCLFVRPYTQLLPAYAAHVVHVDARGLGALLAATGIGAIFGSVVTAVVGSRRRGLVWFASAIVMSLGVAALGLVHTYVFALAVLPFVGLAVLSFAGSTNVMLQTLAPDEMRGRAISVFSMVILGLVPAGSLLLGGAGSIVGLAHAQVAGGLLSLALALWIYLANPALRRV